MSGYNSMLLAFYIMFVSSYLIRQD